MTTEPGDTPTMPFMDETYDQREALYAASKTTPIRAINKVPDVFVSVPGSKPVAERTINAATDMKGRGFALLDDIKALGDRVDQRSLAVARTQFETAMLWLEQALKGGAK